MDKIGRDAFLYLEPKSHDDVEYFAQCGPCRFFVPQKALGTKFDSGRCILHGSHVPINEEDSCGFFADWPDGKVARETVYRNAAELKRMIGGSVTGEESGLVARRVQCHRCRFAGNRQATRCGLYDELNKKLPTAFALDPNIKPHACCNAQMPK
jgi:hypothetical protein